MGEMADYMLNGDDCSTCGEYIGPGDGFERQCSGCAKPRQPKKKTDFSGGQKIRGLTKWLNKNNIPQESWRKLMTDFLTKHQSHLNMNKYKMDRSMMQHISGFCFQKFTNWVLEHKPTSDSNDSSDNNYYDDMEDAWHKSI